MRYLALASDYDGTLATHGAVDPATNAALERFKESGRRLVLVSGRVARDLIQIYPELSLFDVVVAENGAVLYRPQSQRTEALAAPASRQLLELLERRGVYPLAAGNVVIATSQAHEAVVRDALRDLSLAMEVVPNKGALMVLPQGVDKASGLRVALAEIGVAPEEAIGIGDAENDEALLSACGYRVAVANALPALKAVAHTVTRGVRGAGVVELIESVLVNDP
jgi:hypothetical protein